MGLKDWIQGTYKLMYSLRPNPPSRFPEWPWIYTTSRGYCEKRLQKTMLLGLWVYYWRHRALIYSILLIASTTSKSQVNTTVLSGVVKPSPPKNTMTPSCSRMKTIALLSFANLEQCNLNFSRNFFGNYKGKSPEGDRSQPLGVQDSGGKVAIPEPFSNRQR